MIMVMVMAVVVFILASIPVFIVVTGLIILFLMVHFSVLEILGRLRACQVPLIPIDGLLRFMMMVVVPMIVFVVIVAVLIVIGVMVVPVSVSFWLRACQLPLIPVH